eukprot:364188-Chlamydomonas_euryale.AAC.4
MRGLSSRISACEKFAGSSLHKTCLSRPPASGIYGHACPRSRAGLGLGRRERPRPAALAHVLCTDHHWCTPRASESPVIGPSYGALERTVCVPDARALARSAAAASGGRTRAMCGRMARLTLCISPSLYGLTGASRMGDGPMFDGCPLRSGDVARCVTRHNGRGAMPALRIRRLSRTATNPDDLI